MPKSTNVSRKRIKCYGLVNLLDDEEPTPEERLQIFFALMELAKKLNWHTHTEEETEEVRRRWRILKGTEKNTKKPTRKRK